MSNEEQARNSDATAEGRLAFPHPALTPPGPGDGDEDERLQRDLQELLNRHCRENKSNTPDFLLADVMMDALRGFEEATNARARWYGRGDTVAGPVDLSREGEKAC